MAGRQAAFFQILLVVVLGFVERFCRDNLRSDLGGKALRFFQLFLRGPRLRFLLRGMEKDRGTILCAYVGAPAG